MSTSKLVGDLTFAVVKENFLDITPVIARIYAYPKWDRSVADNILCLHFMTDDGTKNTIMPKLWQRAESQIRTAYALERAYGLYDVCFSHSSLGAKIPSQAQLIYARPVSIKL